MTIIHADILDWCKTYTGPKFHALLCDPPYHMTSVVERFGKAGSAEATGDVYNRSAKGFMGKTWDGGDIAFQPSTWAALAEHLYPGAFGMAFASSRGWHRLACAIEDAGLIIHPSIFGWSYGSGFPKATRIDTQIDAAAFRAWLALRPAEQAAYKAAQHAERAARKAGNKDLQRSAKAELTALSVAYKALAGLTPAKLGTKKHQPKFAAAELGYREKDNGFNSRERETFDVMGAATEAAAYWIGHRYGGQALKPALEPIIVFQKPYDGSPLACITSSGAGALWIDGGRIAGEVQSAAGSVGFGGGRSDGYAYGTGREYTAAGRWPANLILSHSPACNGVCAPGCPVASLGAQSGESASRAGGASGTNANPMSWTELNTERPRGGVDDTGTAARFFFQSDYMLERIELADAIQYVAKASRAEREAGLDPRQTAIMRLLDDSDDDSEEMEPWDDQGQSQTTRQALATRRKKDTTASGITESSYSPMLCDGCKSMGLFQKDTKSTTATTTNKTTRSTILNSSTRSHTSDCTAAANSEQMDGGSPVVCAVCSSPLSSSTGISVEKAGRSTENADHATSEALSRPNKIGDFPVSTVNDGRQTPIDNPYQRGETSRQNLHPCIKPISLARYLATLLLPPAQYGPRRLLIPFSGAGSEVIGADLAGWEEVTGVELGADHCAIANARRAYWQQRRWELLDPARKLTVKAAPKVPQGQIDMFVESEAA